MNGMKSGWHPPMMPNSPRDPLKEKREKEAMKAFLLGGGGPSYGLKKQDPMASVHPSQNPFNKPTPTEEEMAGATAAVQNVQYPQIPASPAPVSPAENDPRITPGNTFPQSESWNGNPETEQFYENEIDSLMQNRPASSDMKDQYDETSEVPEVSGDQTAWAAEDGYDDPYAAIGPDQDPARSKLMELLGESNSPAAALQERMSQSQLDERMGDISRQNADLGFMKLLMKNAAQMGQIGGKTASTQGFDEQIGSMQERNIQAGNQFAKTSLAAKTAQDDRKKTLLALLKMDQDAKLARERMGVQKESNAEMNAYRQAMLEATQGKSNDEWEYRQRLLNLKENPPPKPSTPSDEWTKLKLENAKKGLDEYGNKVAPKKEKDQGLPIETETEIRGLANKIVHKKNIVATLDESLKLLQQAKSDQEFYDIGQGILKTMNSLEGPDALGVEETKRLAGDLESLNLGRLTRGENPIGMNKQSFLTSVKNRTNLLKGSIKTNQNDIARARGGNPASGSSAAPESVKVLWKGKTKMIPRERLEEALSLGAKEVQ